MRPVHALPARPAARRDHQASEAVAQAISCDRLVELTLRRAGSGDQPGIGIDPGAGAQAYPRGDGWNGFPTFGTYSQGAAWIAMVLARALHYAHGRQIHHRDVKPANILLTINHGPQLLDFNLAEAPHAADHAQAALRGGTLPYMAPEQIRAFLNPELWSTVGAGADIYSLGLVLRELLTGQMPDLPANGLSAARAMNDLLDRRPHLDTAVRRFNPAIPPSLEAIVVKCLALEPGIRYSDAEALAEDLERFLNHQPLLKATNPSRRERLGNYWMRKRAGLTRAGLVGAGVVILTAALAHPAYEWLNPREPSHPEFQAAVAAVEHGNPRDSIETLAHTVQAFPRSCLVRFYLVFALKDDPKSEYDAKRYLREALAVVDAEKTVLAWSEKHPEFCSLLVDFIEQGIARADEFAQKYDKDDSAREIELDGELRKPGYDLFRQALRLAQLLDPKSPTIQRLLAKTDEIFGDYESSYARLTSVIESNSADPHSSPDILFFCRQTRGRVAFLWVEQQRAKGVEWSDETVKLLEAAVADSGACNGYLQGNAYSEANSIKAYRVLHDFVRATLTLAEVQMDLRRPVESGKQLKNARRWMPQLQQDARRAGLDDSTIANFEQRLKAATERQKSTENIASSP